jgi:hypothetical protein
VRYQGSGCKLWQQRYQLENNLDHIYQKEEMFWQQRGSEKWVLEGDANTTFFHSSASGRRQKTRICALETENGVISDQKDLELHIVNLYKQLFGSTAHKGAHLSNNFWSQEEQMGDEDRRKLEKPFIEKDVALAISGMKTESAPGPNGFSVFFFKKLWNSIKQEILRMVFDFNNATLDLRRLNYGVITLVPKVKEANSIKQYIPICLLNVDFKIFPKLMIDRLTPMVEKIISSNQTAFIRGRNILEGVVILHYIIHVKDRRRLPRWNLAYIPKSIRCLSLLTRSRPSSYK